jgi:hypothetical protein
MRNRLVETKGLVRATATAIDGRYLLTGLKKPRAGEKGVNHVYY